MPDGKHQEAEVSDYAYRLFRDMEGNDAPLPEYFVDAQCLSPNDHLEMQAALQDYVDSSISKTINIPEDFSFRPFADVYMKAYDLRCKGCTTFRPNPIRGSVLEVKKTDSSAGLQNNSNVVSLKDAVPRDMSFRACPKCGTNALRHQENCDSCTSCGYSKCS